ncbi:DUF805 domain-containing protein [Staphylococcus caeli]|uniref:DUF805 domain-containing protein n=1 Tax=Staphylococcus caeli TaxID=2201815 RepID=UPI003F544D7B
MLHYYKLFWKNALNIKGRSRRKEYWYPILMNILLAIVIGLITYALPIPSIIEEVVGWILYILVTIAMFTVTVRRFHDVGMTMMIPILLFVGTWINNAINFIDIDIVNSLGSAFSIIAVILGVIYLVISIVGLVVCFTNGQKEFNKYGDNPKSNV